MSDNEYMAIFKKAATQAEEIKYLNCRLEFSAQFMRKAIRRQHELTLAMETAIAMLECNTPGVAEAIRELKRATGNWQIEEDK